MLACYASTCLEGFDAVAKVNHSLKPLNHRLVRPSLLVGVGYVLLVGVGYVLLVGVGYVLLVGVEYVLSVSWAFM